MDTQAKDARTIGDRNTKRSHTKKPRFR